MSDVIRNVVFTADADGVTPTQAQFAGVQGEHNATEVAFTLDSALQDPAYRYRFEYVDGAGGYDSTDFVDLDNQQAKVRLPQNWTSSGGTGTIRLCAVILDSENQEEQIAYTVSGRLKFAARNGCTPGELAYQKGLSALIADAHDAIEAADEAAENAQEQAEAAQAIVEEVQQKLDNGDFIGPQGPKGDKGDKGDPGEDGVSVVTELSPGMFALSVNEEGHLILTHNDNEPAPPLSIQDGDLIYTIS